MYLQVKTIATCGCSVQISPTNDCTIMIDKISLECVVFHPPISSMLVGICWYHLQFNKNGQIQPFEG